jgi:hypothetical protein
LFLEFSKYRKGRGIALLVTRRWIKTAGTPSWLHHNLSDARQRLAIPIVRGRFVIGRTETECSDHVAAANVVQRDGANAIGHTLSWLPWTRYFSPQEPAARTANALFTLYGSGPLRRSDIAMITLRVACSVSVVIPVFNGATTLQDCLDALSRTTDSSCECIVVDDGSTDDSAHIARRAGARVIESPRRQGPAHARNLGSLAASGEILLFIDADVCVGEGTVARAVAAFAEDLSIVALIGSYDFEPGAPNFLSQYKNLLHSFTHHRGCRDASTFWTGCGAIRRTFFLSTGGFPEHRRRSAVEDIEFGGTILLQGGRIRLDPDLQVKHLKRWNLAGLLRTDIFDRAIPWTLLVLRSGVMPNDLNLRIDQRACVALVCMTPLVAAGFPSLSPVPLLLTILLNLPFFRFLASRRGWWFALRSIPMHLLYFLYSGLAVVTGVVLHAGLVCSRTDRPQNPLACPTENP